MAKTSPKMLKKQAQLKLDLVNCWGMTEDRWGSFKYIAPGSKAIHRVKLNAQSWRLELKVGSRWFKLTGAYYSDPTGFDTLRTRINKISKSSARLVL